MSRRNLVASLAFAQGADGLSSQAHAAFVQKVRAAGKELHVWTVDFLADARHYQQLGVDH